MSIDRTSLRIRFRPVLGYPQEWRFEAGHLRATRQLVTTEQGLHIGEPQTNTGARTVPLDSHTIRLLHNHRKSQAAGWPAWARPGTHRLAFT